MALRLAMAVVVGTLVSLAALLAVWQDMRRVEGLRKEQRETQQRLKRIADAIKLFQQNQHVLPKSLDQLEGPVLPSNEWQVDGWDRPFVYTVSTTSWSVLSYGHDGQPGGNGVDADLTNWNPEPPNSKTPLTLRQFVFELKLTRLPVTCIGVCGLLAGIASYFAARFRELIWRNILKSALVALAVLIAVSIAAFIMAEMQMPDH